jgi:hypothetical protein
MEQEGCPGADKEQGADPNPGSVLDFAFHLTSEANEIKPEDEEIENNRFGRSYCLVVVMGGGFAS